MNKNLINSIFSIKFNVLLKSHLKNTIFLVFILVIYQIENKSLFSAEATSILKSYPHPHNQEEAWLHELRLNDGSNFKRSLINSSHSEVTYTGCVFSDIHRSTRRCEVLNTHTCPCVFEYSYFAGNSIGQPLNNTTHSATSRAVTLIASRQTNTSTYSLFSDITGIYTATDEWGANLGIGLRVSPFTSPNTLGVNFFYDSLKTDWLAEQFGFGLESLGRTYDIRANFYLPIGCRFKEGYQQTYHYPGSYTVNAFHHGILGRAMELEISRTLKGSCFEVLFGISGHHTNFQGFVKSTGIEARIYTLICNCIGLETIFNSASHVQTEWEARVFVRYPNHDKRSRACWSRTFIHRTFKPSCLRYARYETNY